MNPLCPETCSGAKACAAPNVCGDGVCGGLRAQYFENVDLTASKLERTDPLVNFDWGTGVPDPAIQDGTWAVRWTGTVVARFSETYTFATSANDGTRLWVDNSLLVDDWTDHTERERGGTIALTAGRSYAIKLEYFNNNGTAVARLLWSSASEPKAAIPTANLRP